MRIAFVYHFDDHAWTGGRNYFASLFDAMHRHYPSVELVLITGTRTQTTLPQDHPYLEVVRTSLLDRRRPLWFLRQALRLIAGRRHDPLLGGLIDRLGVNVLSHSQPLLARGSKVVALAWLPDFQFLHLPHLWPKAELARMRAGFEEICRNSDGIIVSSEDAKRDLQRFAPWFAKPVHVLHFSPRPLPAATAEDATLRERYGITGPYAFLPNQFWAHKNHAVVVDALRLLEELQQPVTVLCTGKPFDPRQPEHAERLLARVRELGLEDRFRVLGVVPYSDMVGLMRQAHVVINPSRFEGWSTTVEESKAMGKRLVLSDIPVHREQDAPFAYYFDKDEPASLAQALAQAMEAPMPDNPPEQLQRLNERRCRHFADTYSALVRSAVATSR